MPVQQLLIPNDVSSVIGAVILGWSCAFDRDEDRVSGPMMEKAAGTFASFDVEVNRRMAVADWLIRRYAPAWLKLVAGPPGRDVIDLGVDAQALFDLPEIATQEQVRNARPLALQAYRDTGRWLAGCDRSRRDHMAKAHGVTGWALNVTEGYSAAVGAHYALTFMARLTPEDRSHFEPDVTALVERLCAIK